MTGDRHFVGHGRASRPIVLSTPLSSGNRRAQLSDFVSNGAMPFSNTSSGGTERMRFCSCRKFAVPCSTWAKGRLPGVPSRAAVLQLGHDKVDEFLKATRRSGRGQREAIHPAFVHEHFPLVDDIGGVPIGGSLRSRSGGSTAGSTAYGGVLTVSDSGMRFAEAR